MQLVGCLAGLLLPALAWGQAGVYLRPTASIGEFYDDNIFRSVSGKQDDFVSRIGAGAEGGYESDPLTVLGHYYFASEIYAKHPELNNALTLQDGGARLRYLPTRLWDLGLNGGYVESDRPETINIASGILGERTKSRNYHVSPSLLHLWDPLTTLNALYGFNRTEEVGGPTTDTHTGEFVIDRQLSARDTLHLSYVFRHFNFTGDTTTGESSGNGSEDAHIPALGWTRQLSLLSSATLSIGPRISSTGAVTPEALATIDREIRNGKVTFTYRRTQNSVVGRGRPVTTDSVLLSWERQLGNRLFVTVTPGFYNDTGGSFDTQVYRLTLDAFYQINKWLAVHGSYDLFYQEGSSFSGGTSSSGARVRNIVLVELVAFSQFRLY
jgi:hypothetical protein